MNGLLTCLVKGRIKLASHYVFSFTPRHKTCSLKVPKVPGT
jgi:hypothetical protein